VSREAFDQAERLTFERARRHVLEALHAACGALDDPRLAVHARDPDHDVAFADLDIDSFTAIEVALAIEDRTGVELDLGDLLAYDSLNALARTILDRSGRG
jgi:acyl carrier protein